MPTDPLAYERPRTGRALMTWLKRLNIPIRDARFWVIQMLVLVIDVGHLFLEHLEVLGGESELYLLSVSLFLVPVVYAALSFGLRGALPTALWALLLSLPEISLHNWTTRVGIFTQFGIVIAIAAIVARRVDRERSAARALEQANRRLSRLNATAAAVADSLDLDQVLRGTLRAKLDPQKRQLAWVRLLPQQDVDARTAIDARLQPVPTALTPEQEGLTLAACLTGIVQRGEDASGSTHTIVAPLTLDGETVGALGVTQPDEAITADEYQVHTAIANQLGVALNNIRNHASTREALDELSVAKANLDIYVELATEAQEEERKRLSRELHDDILQSLVIANAQIESASAGGPSAQSRERLLVVQEILTETIGNVRRYCRDLRPSILDDLGLSDAIDWLVGDLRSRTGLTIDLVISGTPQRLSGRDELLIFRVVQESLHNVERHAHATYATVTLTFQNGTVTATVADNGRGMAPTGRSGGHPSEPGLGLRGMDERTKLLRGSLRIQSQTGHGTTVSLVVPLPSTSTVNQTRDPMHSPPFTVGDQPMTRPAPL